MKKRLPILISFVLFIALAASSTYWGMQLSKQKTRPVAPPPPAPQAEVPVENAATLFGGKLQVATASNFQVKGVISSKSGLGGTAVILADGQPAQTLGVGGEVAPGVSVKEIHAQYVLLLDNGVPKRLVVPEALPGVAGEGIHAVQPDPNASRMTGPALPVPQPPEPQPEPPQPPVSPQQPPQQQPGEPPQPGGIVGPNGEPLGAPSAQHYK